MVQNDRASRVQSLQRRVQTLSAEIENARNEHHLILAKLEQGSDAYAAFRYNKQHKLVPKQHESKVSHDSVTNVAATVATEKEERSPPDSVAASDKDLKTDGADPEASSPRTDCEDKNIVMQDSSSVDSALKRDQVRQGILVQEDKIRCMLGKMKDRMNVDDDQHE